jgi:two-component system sensor kinase FixL
MTSPGSFWLRYGGAAIATALALLLRWLLFPYFEDRTFTVIYVPVVMYAAFGGGLGPAVFATLLCLGISGLFLRPGDYLHAGNLIDLGFFAVLGPVLGLLGDRLRRESDAASYRQVHLQSILDTLPEAMVVIDDEGLIESFSAAAERLFGWSGGEIVGRNVKLLMPSPYWEEHDDYLLRYRETGERRMIGLGRIVVGRRKDGSTFPMELSVGEGRVAGRRFFTGFIRDLTERTTQERRMQELQSELGHVSRLTAMGEMASSLAHEINQPLAAITNYMRAARTLVQREQPDTKRVTEALERAAEQALRAGDIIKRLREFVAKGETQHTIENPAAVMEEAAALALFGARERSVRVIMRCDQNLPPVVVDRVQVQQVALNLIRNAIEAMDHSTKRDLTITVARRNNMALFAVADTGSGINPEVAERLFQPFVTSKPTGMGVGLSICRTIIESHGGTIRPRPNEGGGTIFEFLLPFADMEAVEEG